MNKLKAAILPDLHKLRATNRLAILRQRIDISESRMMEAMIEKDIAPR